MYNYEEQRKNIFTDEGQGQFLSIRDHVAELLKSAGAFKMVNAVRGQTGDSWTMLACVDRLVELGEIREITHGVQVCGQDRVFVKR